MCFYSFSCYKYFFLSTGRDGGSWSETSGDVPAHVRERSGNSSQRKTGGGKIAPQFYCLCIALNRTIFPWGASITSKENITSKSQCLYGKIEFVYDDLYRKICQYSTASAKQTSLELFFLKFLAQWKIVLIEVTHTLQCISTLYTILLIRET